MDACTSTATCWAFASVFAAYAEPEEIALNVVMEGSRRITSGNVSICNNNGDNGRINKQSREKFSTATDREMKTM
jgi:hypothetical protein